LFFPPSLQFDNDYDEKKVSNETVKAILVEVNDLIKQVSSLMNTLGEQQTSTAAARRSSESCKDETDEELHNKLQHPQLKELYGNFLSWEPKPEPASYHISFM
jgi:hypothetical protein